MWYSRRCLGSHDSAWQRQRYPVVSAAPESPQAKAFLGLADALIKKCPFEQTEKKGMLSGLFGHNARTRTFVLSLTAISISVAHAEGLRVNAWTRRGIRNETNSR